jgi:Ser/Thr protein kinase RdoA (MazF antagonist)
MNPPFAVRTFRGILDYAVAFRDRLRPTMLRHADVAQDLLARGLVEPRDVVDGGLRIVDGSRRNRVFVTTTRAGPTYVVKQGDPGQPSTLAHEARVLRALARVAPLCGRVPAVVEYDAATALLVLVTPGGGSDWGVHHAGAGFPISQARALGELLAAVHRLPPETVAPAPDGHQPMWGLLLAAPPAAFLRDFSAGSLEVVGRIQENEQLCARLVALRERCRADSVVHGDLRWENCVAVGARPGARRTRVLLIDWELAGHGVAAFDVGSVLAEYLRVWVGSIPIVPARDAGLVEHARRPLPRMRPAIRGLWAAYRRARPVAELREVVEFAGLRLLQTAVEQARDVGGSSAHLVNLLHLASNLLSHPDDAARRLLGAPE